MTKGKILHLSDSPLLCTGYSTISLNLMNRLAEKGWDIHYLTPTFLGQKVTQQPLTTFTNFLKPKITASEYEQISTIFSKYKFTMPSIFTFEGIPLNFNLYGQGIQPYCADIIMPKIRQLKPDYFTVLLDTFMLYPWALSLDYSPAKSLFYFPSDGGGGLPENCEQILRKFNIPVAMSRYAQKQAKDLYGIDSQYIPHATDPNHFYKLPDEEREQLKIKYGFKGKFIIGVVARNQGRKMLDRTFYTFKFIAEKYPNVLLLMHTDPDDLAQIFNMRAEIQRLGITHKVVFTGTRYYEPFTYQQMNEIYNLMDIFFLTTSGEGFGIPIIEAMACAGLTT